MRRVVAVGVSEPAIGSRSARPRAAVGARLQSARRRRRWVMIGLLLAGTACSRRSTDDEIRLHLTVELAAGLGALYPGQVTFAVTCVSHGAGVSFVGRRIVVTVDDRAVPMPSPWDREMRDWIGRDTRQIRFWHMDPVELESWLGGPGSHCVQAAIGPAVSDPITIEFPGPVIVSPPVEH